MAAIVPAGMVKPRHRVDPPRPGNRLAAAKHHALPANRLMPGDGAGDIHRRKADHPGRKMARRGKAGADHHRRHRRIGPDNAPIGIGGEIETVGPRRAPRLVGITPRRQTKRQPRRITPQVGTARLVTRPAKRLDPSDNRANPLAPGDSLRRWRGGNGRRGGMRLGPFRIGQCMHR